MKSASLDRYRSRSATNIRNVEIDAHSTDSAIVVRYESGSEGKHQSVIQLKDLNKAVDVGALSRHVLSKCSIIPEHRLVDVEQIIYYLQKRAQSTQRTSFSFQSSVDDADIPGGQSASIDELEDYVEMLSDDEEKVKGAALILQLSRNIQNLENLIENEPLMGALARVFREDWKKNFDLATNIANIFVQLSKYHEFQPIISHFKIGALSMQVIEYELKRWELWKVEVKKSAENARKKWELAIAKQDRLVAACLQILLHLSTDTKVEFKMVNRGLVHMLTSCLDHTSAPNLLLVTVAFLLKLSAFLENKDAMALTNVVEKCVPLFNIKNRELNGLIVRLMFNLSFDSVLRGRMVTAGLVGYVAPEIKDDQVAMKLFYQLSVNDDAKAMTTFTDCIEIIMRQILEGGASRTVKAILINISLEKRNAQLVCGADGQGLDLVMGLALENTDILMMKAIRNIASHHGPTQDNFAKWVPDLATVVLDYCEQTDSHHYCFGVECLGTMAQLVTIEWSQLEQTPRLMKWIETKLELSNTPREAGVTHPGERSFATASDELVLQILILLGTMATHLESARFVVPLVDHLIKILKAKQEDDEMVIQIVYIFHGLLKHREFGDRLVNRDSDIVAYLIDLMYDRNAPIRAICDEALQVIADSNEELRRRIDGERFKHHNSQWLEMVSRESDDLLSDGNDDGDLFNPLVVGAEDLLEDFDDGAVNDRRRGQNFDHF
ncbi:hypothetical protein QR680_011840 [Steinernema hermaphroditum]|uniref:Kinesin-associated protein 3 n=1 Tax=Steinernema hermaphroditum TaxID=289476 RepID=A0AA39LZF5_9BILA|nr:hypothetical protein QR680_011840 [Steinernema hermaphroditum]